MDAPAAHQHQTYETHYEAIASDQETLFKARKDLEDRGLTHLIPTLESLKDSHLFLHVLKNQGLNGEGIDWVFQIMEGQPDKQASPLAKEDIPLLQFPVCKATQERFLIFQKELEALLENYAFQKVTICSIPCGYMRDLFSLKSTKSELHFIGIDKDPNAIKIAEEKTKQYSKNSAEFFQKDIFDLDPVTPCDIVLSNGFNFYLDDAKVKTFNFQIAKLVKPGGYLITSHLTEMGEWNFAMMDPKALTLEKTVLSDIVKAKFLPFMRPSKKIIHDIEMAGFKHLRTVYDQAKRFPTFVFQKI